MSTDNEMKSTRNGKQKDRTFHPKHVKHDPAAESARAVFGLRASPKAEEGTDYGKSGNEKT
jgi:hypothetical protein